jgi:predicted ArsR family transcriptional regulator
MEMPGPSAGDVLAQPTRAKLFELLTDMKREASTEELAERLGLHVNGVRRQLERLREAGLLTRNRRPRGRGRPRDLWAIASDADPGGERPRAYSDLAAWLASAIPPGPGRLRQVERTGREIGRALAPRGTDGTARAFEQVLTALGFQPQVELAPNGAVCCRLGNCPYLEAVRENQPVVCTLHKGLTQGLLDQLSPEARLTGFVPKDPESAGCLIEVESAAWRGPPAAPPA